MKLSLRPAGFFLPKSMCGNSSRNGRASHESRGAFGGLGIHASVKRVPNAGMFSTASVLRGDSIYLGNCARERRVIRSSWRKESR